MRPYDDEILTKITSDLSCCSSLVVNMQKVKTNRGPLLDVYDQSIDCEPTLKCSQSHAIFHFKSDYPFQGHIEVVTKESDQRCREDYTANLARSVSFRLPLDGCFTLKQSANNRAIPSSNSLSDHFFLSVRRFSFFDAIRKLLESIFLELQVVLTNSTRVFAIECEKLRDIRLVAPKCVVDSDIMENVEYSINNGSDTALTATTRSQMFKFLHGRRYRISCRIEACEQSQHNCIIKTPPKCAITKEQIKEMNLSKKKALNKFTAPYDSYVLHDDKSSISSENHITIVSHWLTASSKRLENEMRNFSKDQMLRAIIAGNDDDDDYDESNTEYKMNNGEQERANESRYEQLFFASNTRFNPRLAFQTPTSSPLYHTDTSKKLDDKALDSQKARKVKDSTDAHSMFRNFSALSKSSSDDAIIDGGRLRPESTFLSINSTSAIHFNANETMTIEKPTNEKDHETSNVRIFRSDHDEQDNENAKLTTSPVFVMNAMRTTVIKRIEEEDVYRLNVTESVNDHDNGTSTSTEYRMTEVERSLNDENEIQNNDEPSGNSHRFNTISAVTAANYAAIAEENNFKEPIHHDGREEIDEQSHDIPRNVVKESELGMQDGSSVRVAETTTKIVALENNLQSSTGWVDAEPSLPKRIIVMRNEAVLDGDDDSEVVQEVRSWNEKHAIPTEESPKSMNKSSSEFGNEDNQSPLLLSTISADDDSATDIFDAASEYDDQQTLSNDNNKIVNGQSAESVQSEAKNDVIKLENDKLSSSTTTATIIPATTAMDDESKNLFHEDTGNFDDSKNENNIGVAAMVDAVQMKDSAAKGEGVWSLRLGDVGQQNFSTTFEMKSVADSHQFIQANEAADFSGIQRSVSISEEHLKIDKDNDAKLGTQASSEFESAEILEKRANQNVIITSHKSARELDGFHTQVWLFFI
ncbi:unnamed protein product [Anisakis simplex]|uniref:ZP domain-containing protein n=1 Tax=Anisakis simplex TaxID=6269 RepID=A0A0M3K019_ANISI|nr:unnamed protein product [Anisakis simplex]